MDNEMKNQNEESPKKSLIKEWIVKSKNAVFKSSLVRKIKKVVIVFILGFATGVIVCVVKPWENKIENLPFITRVDGTIIGENYSLTISNIQELMEPASDLVSTRYYYTDADTYENYKEVFGKRVPLTTDKVIFTYNGVIGIGIDLSEIKYDIDNSQETINVTLPEFKILSNEIDASSFEFPYMSDSIFNSTGMDDYMELIDTLKQLKAEEAIKNKELMDGALENVKKVMENLLAMSDITKDYKIIFK